MTSNKKKEEKVIINNSADLYKIPISILRNTKVYNFQTEGFNTYFITSVGILVHNSCGKTEVHHVVEQCQENKSGFSKSQIQSDSNKVTIPYETHRKISGYYSSKQPFSNGLRVRDWLAGKSFEEQSNFGWSVILRFLD